MSTTINIHTPLGWHGAKMLLRVSAGATSGAPFCIEAIDKEGYAYAEVTWFLNDHALAQRIAEAVNTALAYQAAADKSLEEVGS